MGVIVGLIIGIAGMIIPPILILRSKSPTGWNKTKWALGCFLSNFAPGILVAILTAALIKFGIYEQTPSKMPYGGSNPFGPWPVFISLILPWVVYFIFRKKYQMASYQENEPDGKYLCAKLKNKL